MIDFENEEPVSMTAATVFTTRGTTTLGRDHDWKSLWDRAVASGKPSVECVCGRPRLRGPGLPRSRACLARRFGAGRRRLHAALPARACHCWLVRLSLRSETWVDERWWRTM
jgi:hypothetical protein